MMLFLLSGSMIPAVAQSPTKMSYQAVIRDAANNLIVNHAVRTKVSLLSGSPAGTKVYSEIQQSTTNANGLVTFVIGEGTGVTGDMNTINWALGPFYIKTETDPTGGTNYTITGTSQLLSVPFALYAANGGTPGPKGDKGDTGLQGLMGLKGDKGDNGLPGLMGLKGDKGDKGDRGLDGPEGPEGLIGLTGATGPAGPTGANGANGSPGATGLTGAQGPVGPTGLQGLQGIQGPQGIQGIQGIQGPVGPVGGSNQQIIFNDNNVAAGNPKFLFDKNSNNLVLGSSTINPNAAFEISSVTGAFILPRLSTDQRDLLAGSPGMMIYNTDEDKFQGYANEFTSQISAGSEVSTADYSVHNFGDEKLSIAQSFKTSVAGELRKIELKISSFDPGFSLELNLFDGELPGTGELISTQHITVNSSGWISVFFPSGLFLQTNMTYNFILTATDESPDQASVFTSDASSEGEHPYGNMFIYNVLTSEYEASPLDDMDFQITIRTNSPGWRNLY